MAETLLIGSGNPKKARELAELLEGLPWQVKSLRDFPTVEEPEENGATFEENSLIKARYYAETFGVACVADDSGLVVDALDGAPGVYSARYAGPEADDNKNNAKLLTALEEYLWHERTARFVCCATFFGADGAIHVAKGTVEGHISMQPFGGNGFGYDPLFVPEGYDCTFGEMPVDKKHGISHRGNAFRDLRAWLESRP